MEACVDDLVVKSHSKESHIEKLAQSFVVCRQYNMLLNPNKCAFSVRSSKFLGYFITQCGVEANLEKIEAIMDM